MRRKANEERKRGTVESALESKESRLASHASRFTLRDLADGAFLVEYPDLSEEEANFQAVAAARELERRAPSGLLDAVPGARTLFVEFDPAATARERLAPFLERRETARGIEPRRTLRVPVFYGGEAGSDLADVARSAGLSPEEFSRRHAGASYRVAFLGFAPGFAYLTGLPAELHAARLPTPRTLVPPGAVAIGGPYTGIYPGSTPGGWRLIGRTAVRIFDPDVDPPALFSPGDQVFFEPIAEKSLASPSLHPTARSPDHPTAPALMRVLSPGVFSSVQGAPRYGWSRYGVPPGGAMDPVALALGNGWLGNPAAAPALEMTLVGAEVEALADSTAVLSGGDAEAEINGRRVEVGQAIRLNAGDCLRVGRILQGARTYLCVAGGLAQPSGPELSPRLAKGDLLRAASAQPRVLPSLPSGKAERDFRTGEAVVRVVLGPHQGHFTEEGFATFLSSVYSVSASSDRRGIRLEGTPIELAAAPDIPPEGTPLGGVQVARDGQPIVLGPDRPVTGGYARIATVIRSDFPLLAQAISGSTVKFVSVGLAEALAARVG